MNVVVCSQRLIYSIQTLLKISLSFCPDSDDSDLEDTVFRANSKDADSAKKKKNKKKRKMPDQTSWAADEDDDTDFDPKLFASDFGSSRLDRMICY
jgi:hypothetical protein